MISIEIIRLFKGIPLVFGNLLVLCMAFETRRKRKKIRSISKIIRNFLLIFCFRSKVALPNQTIIYSSSVVLADFSRYLPIIYSPKWTLPIVVVTTKQTSLIFIKLLAFIPFGVLALGAQDCF